jgi:hypothetical protein
VYAGGIAGRSRNIWIRNAESTIIIFEPEAVGALRISGDEKVCGAATSLQISRLKAIRDGESTTSSVSAVVTLTLEDGCEQVVAGLSPGAYEVSYKSALGLLGTKRAAVSAQRYESLAVAAAQAHLRGAVKLNQAPATNVTIVFTAVESDPVRTASVSVDAQGEYEVDLPFTGDVGVSFRTATSTLLGHDDVIHVAGGESTYNWSLNGRTLTITVSNWDSSAPVTLDVLRLAVERPGSIGVQQRVYPDGPIRFDGLAVGTYRVTARQSLGGGVRDKSAGAVATLTDDMSYVAVRLELKVRDVAITVTDQQRRPVSSAVVTIDGVDGPLGESSGGRFEARDAPPGARVRVSAPGYTPVCRFLPDTHNFRVVLSTGVTREVFFAGGARGALPVGQLVGGDLECPISLRQLPASVVEETTGGVLYLFHNFPDIERLYFNSGPFFRPQRLQRVPRGPARVKLSVDGHPSGAR